jgi:nitrogenase molybdenum-iron protein beta chain
MLLRHTTSEVKERSALTINPAKTCQPVGAMYAALGLHGCLPHSHGSQGCCSYHRSALTRHYKEPVMAATSSFTEGSSVFGGQANLLQAIQNIFSIYDPKVIAVHTTCLSETIGDDVNQISQKAIDDGKVPDGKYIIHCHTPSYVGSHVTGFANMVEAMAKTFPEPSDTKNNTINLIPGWVEPSDMRELKRMMTVMGVKTIMFPDTSDVMDAPQTGEHVFYPKGGARIEDLKKCGASRMTLALGHFCSVLGAKALEKKTKVPFQELDIPIGLAATDRFVARVAKLTDGVVPVSLEDERGRLMDLITDMHQYLYGKRVALFGDPDILVPLAEFLLDLDMKPVYIVSGTQGKEFMKKMDEKVLSRLPEAIVKCGAQADMYYLHQLIKKEPVDLLIGNTYGKYIARDENIPLLRIGFPIVDRVGHSYFPNVGYTGALRMVVDMLNMILDKKDRESPETSFELVL